MSGMEPRYYKALAAALGIHILAAGVLGIYAWLPTPQNEKVIEVSLAGAPKKKGVLKPAVAPKQKPKPKPVRIKPKQDDIIEKKPIEQVEEKPEEEIPETQEASTETTTDSVATDGEVGEQGSPDGVEGGKEDGNGGQDGVAVKLPYVTYKVEPNYPNECKLKKQEGTVTLRVMVSEEGKAIEASVVGSSGFETMDASAVKAVYKWRFSPARNAKGVKIRCYVNFPIVFKLK